MSKIVIRLVTLLMYATSVPVIPMIIPAQAETSSSKHMKKHMKTIRERPGFSGSWSAGQTWPVTRPSGRAGAVCPGIARSFECGTWPPPFDDDPDRKASGTDAGG
jgi:hypothetical protein